MIHWNVYYENVNRRRIEVIDLFDTWYMSKECPKILKACGEDKSKFEDMLEDILKYQYWARCEYEVILTGWPKPSKDTFKELKIDIYNQVTLNWDAFVDYVWAHREELRHEWK